MTDGIKMPVPPAELRSQILRFCEQARCRVCGKLLPWAVYSIGATGDFLLTHTANHLQLPELNDVQMAETWLRISFRVSVTHDTPEILKVIIFDLTRSLTVFTLPFLDLFVSASVSIYTELFFLKEQVIKLSQITNRTKYITKLDVVEITKKARSMCHNEQQLNELFTIELKQRHNSLISPAWDTWFMESSDFTHLNQWMPREIMEDVAVLTGKYAPPEVYLR